MALRLIITLRDLLWFLAWRPTVNCMLRPFDLAVARILGVTDMAYVIAAPCVADYSCIEVCPVDAISPGPQDKEFVDAEQMYINPDKCIDCSVCVVACPVSAIYRDDSLPEIWEHYTELNREYFHQGESK